MVFHDPTGRRRRWLHYGEALAAVASALIAAACAMSLLEVRLPATAAGRAVEPARASARRLRETLPTRELNAARLALSKGLPAEEGAAPAREEPVVGAFFWPGPQPNLDSLRANADRLTHLFPQRLHLSTDGGHLSVFGRDAFERADDDEAMRVAREHKLHIQPMLDNAIPYGFDPERVHRLLSDPRTRRSLIDEVVEYLSVGRYDGVNIDFESRLAADDALFPVFLAELGAALRGRGMQLSLDIEVSTLDSDLSRLAAPCDFVVLMAYDEHAAEDPAGPIASFGWYRQALDKALATIPREKLVLGVGNYAYDWTEGSAHAKELTYRQAAFTLKDRRPNAPPAVALDFDPSSLNPTGEYRDDGGAAHRIWALDAVTAADQWLLARRRGARGAALWALGSEDPALWRFLDRRRLRRSVDFAALRRVEFLVDAETVGEGEIFTVAAGPQSGERRLELDARTGLCVDEAYQRFPTVYEVRQSGRSDKTLALTFDDGPDGRYTPAVLDKLKELGVPATFFVVGQNALARPDLLRRMWEEGHEIGNHSFTHPDPARVSQSRFRLEVNATQRVVQSITGRSTLLFRPPYNGGPTLLDEVKPMVVASDLGYWTIDDSIDPKDWNRVEAGPLIDDRAPRAALRTAQDIANQVIWQTRSGIGNVVLLHDAGGDRSKTVAALSLFVPQLRKLGYRFVPVSELIGVRREQAMPPVEADEGTAIQAAAFVFQARRWTSAAVGGCIVLAIGLVTLRWLLLTVLAWLHWRRGEKEDDARRPDAECPSVTVIISAYNEEKVIARTIEGVLASGYPDLEVLVVDDGSTDGTAVQVYWRYARHPRVRLIRQENAGKSEALNNGIAQSLGEILICLDADTLLMPDAVARLAARFSDPSVGAAAGVVKACNAKNLISRCQQVEYITNQNLERRAYESLNAVTVVPGAIGAWRRRAIVEAGGYGHDTLAEDMDLTWRIRRLGWKIVTESRALGYTEVPETVGALYTQRSRWTYGTLQCLWKHADVIGGCGWFGALVLPSVLIFQFVFQLIAPLIDLQLLAALWSFALARLPSGGLPPSPESVALTTQALKTIGMMYSYFMALELAGSLFAFKLDGSEAGNPLVVLWQRLFYRYFMWAIVAKSLRSAVKGLRGKWNKLARTGSLALPAAPTQAPTPSRPAALSGALGVAVAACVLLLARPAARAAEADLAYKGTFGAHDYQDQETTVSAGLDSGFSVNAGLELHQSDFSSGTYRTYSAGLGFWRPYAELYVYGSLTPLVGTYKSESFGASTMLRLLNAGRARRGRDDPVEGQPREPGERPVRLYLIAEYGRTFDTDVEKPSNVPIYFHALTGGVKLIARKTSLELLAVKYLYDQDLRSPAYQRLESTLPQILSYFPQGYPRVSQEARLTQDLAAGFWLLGRVYHADYLLAPTSASMIYAAGAGWAWKGLSLSAQYQDYRQNDNARAQNFATANASYRFGN